MKETSIAILVPCHNEALTIKDVVTGFQETLPHCIIYVYDNNSTDDTALIAKNSGAVVRHEYRIGKGNTVRRMFSDIEADVYVLIDGDNTYEIKMAPKLIETLINNQLDMVVGTRVEAVDGDKYKTYRFGHRFGNALFSSLIARLFGKEYRDVFSGFRVFSKRFVKSFPANANGFEIEMELTVHALELSIPTVEIDTLYKARPEGSVSKLNSYKDGARILTKLILLVKEIRPFFFFTSISLFLILLSTIMFYPVLIDYLHTGLVKRFPTTILSTGIMLSALISFTCGIILDSIARGRKEIKRLFYLNKS